MISVLGCGFISQDHGINIIQNMIKTIAICCLILVSSFCLSASPSWTRDIQIDSGQLKAVNFQIYLKGNTSGILGANQSTTKSNHFNYTLFPTAPRVLVAMKSYGVIPSTNVTSLSMGFKFNITSINRTNFTYTVSTTGVALVALHYQYFAVVAYTHLYYMEYYAIILNSTSNTNNVSSSSPRVDYIELANPGGFVAGSNISSSQLVLQVWPYYFSYVPTGQAISFNVSGVISSTTSFTVSVTADSGCSMSQVGITVLYFNKTKVYENSYSQFFDKTVSVVTGSDQTNIVTTSTMGNISLQYQFRNSEEGIQGISLSFSAILNPTVFYFAATSQNTSKLYFVAIQQKQRVCSGLTPVFLVDDQLCYDMCPTYYYGYNSTYGYCKKCHYSCLNCSSPDVSTVCTLCNSTSFRYLTNNSCPCNLTYYDNGSQLCLPCHYTCLTCSNDFASGCLTCDSSGLHRTISNSTCPCSSGYYQNTTCFPCLYSCTECSFIANNQTIVCTACNSSLFMQVDPTQTFCICQSGYYNNSNVCAKCIAGCQSCTDGVSCDTCNTTANWQINMTDNTCKCIIHFYLLTINSTSTCQACDSTCLTCTNSLSSSCLSCDSSINRNLTNTTCACSYGYYDNITCISCINSCMECHFNQGNQTFSCLACNSSLFLTLNSSSSSCQCQAGYYNSSGVCNKCMSGCLLCSSGSTCESCDSANSWQKNASDNTCKCMSTFYIQTINGTSSCASCHYTCLTCSGNLDNECLSCDSAINRNLTSSACQCSTGYYSNITCLTCLNNCTQCSYSSTNNTYQCKSCNSSLHQEVDATQQYCVCSSGHHNNSGICEPCIDGCVSCSSSLTCVTCNSTANWQKNVSDDTCICVNQFYLSNSTCTACPTGCLSCQMNSTLSCDQCNTTAHFNLSNGSCTCQSGYQLNSTSCKLIITVSVCGNGVVELSQACDDGNVDNLDGCSSICSVESDHICLNNITSLSICYYSQPILLTTQQIFKIPLENRFVVTILVSAPNCNETYLKVYLQESTSIILITRSRLLLSSDITSQSVKYDPSTNLASVDVQYNRNIDLTQKEMQFVSSQSYGANTTKYFYDSPSTSIPLSNPTNLLLTTYSSPEDIKTIKGVSYAFLALIILMWFFWIIGLCYNQTATVVEFMIVIQIAYESLLQRKYITDGWIGLVIYGKYSYGYNYDYSTEPIYDRLRILSLDTYLFHTLNITTVLLVGIALIIFCLFFYETIKVVSEPNQGELTSTDAKIDLKSSGRASQVNQQQKQYKIKKGVTLFLFEAGASLSLLTVKIAIISLMLISVKVAVEVAIVSSLLGACYIVIWYFYYRCFGFQFMNDFSYRRMLRDIPKKKSMAAKFGNVFVKYYYLCIFILLALFGVAAGSPSFGAPFYIIFICISVGTFVLMAVYGVYFRKMHLVRSACNIFGLIGVMVLHMLQSINTDPPQQTITGPIICLSILYFTFLLNFGIITYIQIRRNSIKKGRYSNAKVMPLDKIQHNDTLQPQLPEEPKIQIDFVQIREDLRRSDHSNESLSQENKFESLRSKSNEHSVPSTEKKKPVQRNRIDYNQQTNEKKLGQQNIDSILKNIPEQIVVRQKMGKQERQENEHYSQNSQVQRIEVMDVSRSFSDLAKTKTKIKHDGKAKQPIQSQTNKKKIQFVDIQKE